MTHDGVAVPWWTRLQNACQSRPPSKLRDALVKALGSEKKEDSEIQIYVQALERGGASSSDVGLCHISLEELLEKGKGARGRPSSCASAAWRKA